MGRGSAVLRAKVPIADGIMRAFKALQFGAIKGW